MLPKLLSRLARSGLERAADRLIAKGNRAEQAGRLSEACELYSRAAASAPRYAKAHLNLGIGLEASGDAERAERAYREALALDDGDAYANYNLGKLLYARGALQEAGRHVRAALSRKPEFQEARIVLSNVHDAEGNLPAAATELELVLKQAPDHHGVLYNYALVLWKLNRGAEAEAAMRRALAADPRNAQANYWLAVILYSRGELADAERFLRMALLCEPVFPDAHAALYEIYNRQNKTEAAAAELELALKHRPDWADALHNYGMMMKKMWKVAEAENAFRRVVAVDPKHVLAQRMLGGMLLAQSRVEEAIASFEQARKSNPDRFDLESAELFALLFSEDVSDDELFARHKALGARMEGARPPRFAPLRNRRDPERRLRIGYVSGNFAYHAVSLFLIPVLEGRDRSAHEIYCYSVGEEVDDVTRQMPARVDQWRDATAMSAEQLAGAINGDAIDILVDLSGHSGIPALETFALQPAPVQVAWLGYLNTTGMTRIQYRLCDRHTDPAGVAERFHTEALVRLPNSQWCYRPFIPDETPKAPPCARNGFVTFGSFNQAAKLSPAVRRLWGEILRRVPDSRLVVIGVPDGPARDRLVADMTQGGVNSGRIDVVPRVSLTEYFRWFHAVDIALDTLPYSGGTTTCDALWMGVPVITAPGTRSVSRSTASILSTVGLEDWISPTLEDYAKRAVEFARDRALLGELRGSLRARMLRSPMMDEKAFVRDLESAYRTMWRAWCERRD